MSRLFVFVPALSGRTTHWDALRARLGSEEECRGATFRVWPESARDRVRLLSFGRTMESYSLGLSSALHLWDQEADGGERYTDIVLVGCSIGALVARWAWLDACGEFDPGRAYPWTRKVSRIVLAAGLSRGYVVNRAKIPRARRIVLRTVGVPAAAVLRLTCRDALAGSFYVTNLRLTWMRHLAETRRTGVSTVPDVAQLECKADTLLERDDWRDAEQFPNAEYLEIPDANHGNVLAFHTEERYQVLRSRFLDPVRSTDPQPVPDVDAVTDVAFLVHGIRSGVGSWVEDIDDAIRAAGGEAWKVIKPTYRYFSALAFAIPFTRQRKVFWFLDEYSRLVAQYPDAARHFVGHSNGTYLLGRAMHLVPAVRFERVYLASSPLRADYPWEDKLDRPPLRPPGSPDRRQVGLIRSDRGSRDWIVGFLAEGLRWFSGRRDVVGGGGFEGFAQLTSDPAVQWKPVRGGHSAPLERRRQAGVVAFAMMGELVPPDDQAPSSPFIGWLNRVGRWLLPLLIGGLVTGAVLGARFGEPAVPIGIAVALVVALVAAASF